MEIILTIASSKQAGTERLSKLEKRVYDLTDAARKIYFAVWEEFKELGWHS